MRVTRSSDKFVFHLGKRETHLLMDLLKLYPQVPSAHHRLSKSKSLPDPETNQRLLDDALVEHRAESSKQLQALLADPRRSKTTDSGHRLSFSEAELEWFLQVLNDIRVGSWVRLGCPEPKLDLTAFSPENAPHYWAMEMAGHFQMQLIEALEGA